MEFVKNSLSKINLQEDTLYEFIYELFFFKALAESEDDIKMDRVIPLEELDKEMEAQYESCDNK